MWLSVKIQHKPKKYAKLKLSLENLKYLFPKDYRSYFKKQTKEKKRMKSCRTEGEHPKRNDAYYLRWERKQIKKKGNSTSMQPQMVFYQTYIEAPLKLRSD